MGTIINLNDITPAAPAGRTNVKWLADNANPRNVSANFPTPSLAGDSDVLLTSPAIGDVLEFDGTKWTNSASSSGGVPIGSNVVIAAQRTGTDSGFGSLSAQKQLKSGSILNLATTWKFSLSFNSGGGYVINAVVYRTLIDSTTIVDATAVTWNSGSATGNLNVAGELFCDPISLPLDTAHDYYIVVYFQSGSGNLNIYATPGTVLPNTLFTGFVSGDKTGLTGGGSIPNISPEETIYRVIST